MHVESAGGDIEGTLFGVPIEGGYRIVAARIQAQRKDPLLTGLEPLGIFASRVRGEVFLTDSDLARLEKSHAIALVLAGETAGFFVREAGGSIQSIQSYEEFPAPRPLPAKRSVKWIVTAALACLGLLIAAFQVPHRPPPVGLTVQHEIDGQLRITWMRVSGGSLDIFDGADRMTIPISPDMTSATYMARTANVRVELRSRAGPRPATLTAHN